MSISVIYTYQGLRQIKKFKNLFRAAAENMLFITGSACCVSRERIVPRGGAASKRGGGNCFQSERELQEKRRKHFVENLFPGQEENALRKCGNKSREV